MEKEQRHFLYQVISAAFCVIVVISNIISAKLIQLPLFELTIPAGLVTYPLTFLLTDLATEIYGQRAARQMVYIAFGMSLLSFLLIQGALVLPGGDTQAEVSFQLVLGTTSLRIFSSLTAFIVAQIADIKAYAVIKKWTGSQHLWLRNNGATVFAQLLDTAVVDILFLYWGLGMPLMSVMPIMLFSYLYKTAFSFVLTPLFYLSVFLLRSKVEEYPLPSNPVKA